MGRCYTALSLKYIWTSKKLSQRMYGLVLWSKRPLYTPHRPISSGGEALQALDKDMRLEPTGDVILVAMHFMGKLE